MKKKGVIILAGVALLFACKPGHNIRHDQETVQCGHFSATLVEAGELQALHSRVIIAPVYDWDYGRPKIVALEKEGKKVNKGDWVGQIDTTGVVRYRIQKESDLAIEQANLKTLLVQNEITLKQLEADLLVQQAALTQAGIDTQRTLYEAQADQEISRLKYKIAAISYAKAKRNIANTRLIQTQDLLIQRDKIRRIRADIDKANRTISTYRLEAPINGMVVYKMQGRRHSRQKIKVGDEIRRGSPLIGLPDLSHMKATATINETDIGKISIGLPVNVRLDAFPRQIFRGKIVTIGTICRDKDDDSHVKVFDIEILLDGVKPICRPGMTVNCEIITAEYDDVLFVASEFISDADDGYIVAVMRGGKKTRVPVRLGARNNDFVVVAGDIRAGEKLVHPDQEGQI